ncbi:hypothetical protein JST97_35325 [bacterium]|nr:hypothetical protein [bacterium]
MKLSWSSRAHPLAIEGAWAQGAAAQQLQRKIRERGLNLQCLDFPEQGLVVLGDDLPWVEQLTYLGRQGQIYTPTVLQPDLPLEWLAEGLARKGPPPWVLLPEGRVLSLR